MSDYGLDGRVFTVMQALCPCCVGDKDGCPGRSSDKCPVDIFYTSEPSTTKNEIFRLLQAMFKVWKEKEGALPPCLSHFTEAQEILKFVNENDELIRLLQKLEKELPPFDEEARWLFVATSGKILRKEGRKE